MAPDFDVVPVRSDDEVPGAVEPEPVTTQHQWVRSVGLNLGVIAVFTVPAVLLWWDAWNKGARSTVRCPCLDPGQQVWFIAWPAYALAHLKSPFSTTWLWPPHGVNLLANASATLVGIVLAPITWAFGAFVATTVALTLAPAVSAWGCWVACRRFVTWQPAWWVAGFFFGYSPFVVESVAQGHLSTGLLVLPPLMLVVLHETLVRQQRSAMWCGVTLALLVTAQFLISAEVLTIVIIVAVGGLAVAAMLAPHRAMAGLPFTLRAFGVAALASLLLLAAPVWYMVAGPQRIKGAVWSSLHTFFIARVYELWSPGPDRTTLFPGAMQGPQVQYVGFGVLVVAGICVAMAWRRRAMWVMAIIAVGSTVLSWGGILWLSPDHVVLSHWLPWSWFTNLPELDNINAIHFSVTADLAVAVVVAIGLDAFRSSQPWHRLPAAAWAGVVIAVTAAMMLPVWLTYQAPLTVQPIGLPPWYATTAQHVPAGSVITSYPFPASASVTSQPMVWQAADGMRFRLAGGYVKVPGVGQGVIGTGTPDSALRTLVDLTLVSGPAIGTFPLTAPQLVNVRAALRSWGTSYIVVTDTGGAPTEAAGLFTAATGTLPQIAHRAWVWNLRTQPLRSQYSATSAANAFAACRGPGTQLGPVPSNLALPQTFNHCVLAGVSNPA